MATTQQEVIKKFMASLDNTDLSGEAALDEAIKACSNSQFTTIQSVIDQMIADCQNASNAYIFLNNYCDINLDNEDTGAITGLDAGGDISKNAEDIVPENEELLNFTGDSFTVYGLTVYLAEFDRYYGVTPISYSSLTDNQKFIWQALYTWWIKGGLDLIAESYGNNFGFDEYSSATVKELSFGFYNSNDGSLNWTISGFNEDNECVRLSMAINMYYYSNVDTGNKNGHDRGIGYFQSYLDRTLAHEFTHAVMMSNIKDCYNLCKIILEGMAELTHGIDDTRKSDILKLAGNSSLLSQALTLSTSYNSVTGIHAPDYAGGYMLLRYIAKKFSDTEEDNTFTDNNENYINTETNVVFSALGGNDTISNYAEHVTILGGAGNDSMYNKASNVSISGDSGNDIIYTEGNNHTISGGTGDDFISFNSSSTNNIIQYTDGNDIIDTTDKFYSSATNTLQITSGTISKTDISGSDFIIYVGSGSIKLKNAVGYNLNVKLANGTDTILKTEKEWTVSGTTASYGTMANPLIVITGLKSGLTATNGIISGITLGNNNVVTLSSNVLDTADVNISGDYQLALANGISAPSNNSAYWIVSNGTAKYQSASNSAGYTLSNDKKSVDYTAAVAEQTLTTITGLKSTATLNDFSLSGNTVTLKSSALGTDRISINGDYQLALANGISAPSNNSAYWIVSNGTAKYQSASTNAGYTLSSDKKSVDYTAAVAETNLATITGLKSTATVKDFSLSGNVVTLNSSALGTDRISINGDYQLALANGISAPSNNSAYWIVSNGTAKYQSASNSAGYTLSNDKKSVNYIAAVAETNLATITGLKSTATLNDFSLSGNTVTLKSSALGTGTAKISIGYKLALSSNVKKSTTTAAGFTVKGTTATYKTASTLAGYTLSSNKKSVTYSKASGGSTLFKISGLKKNTSASNLKLKNKVVTLKAAALTTTTVKISNGYKLALESNIKKSTKKSAGWSVNKTIAIYKTASTSAGYALSSDKKSVTYSKANNGSTIVTLSGLKSGLKSSNGKISGLTLKNKTVTLSSSVLSKNGVSVKGAGYSFVLKDKGNLTNVGKAAILKGSSKNDTLIGGKYADTLVGNAGADILSGGKGNDSLNGGAGSDTLIGGSGNDTLTGGKGNDIFVYSKSTGKDIITDYTAGQDKIELTSGTISKATVSGKDVIFKIGSGTLTVKNGKGKKITVNDVTKTYSKNISELWFADENNFANSNSIYSIVKKESVADFESAEDKKVTQENLITYSK